MSSSSSHGVPHDLVDKCKEFLKSYYSEEIANLESKGTNALYIEYGDMYRFDHKFADDYLNQPDRMNHALKQAVSEVDLPVVPPDDVRVRVRDERGFLDPVEVNELSASDLGTFVAVRGQLNKISGITYRYKEMVFNCARCGTGNPVYQSSRQSVSEPHECQGCERKGPFSVNPRQSTLIDHCKLKLKEPPGNRARGTGEDITVFAERDLCYYGGENGLADHAGERVIILGKFTTETENVNKPETTGHLIAESVIFTEPTFEDITVEETREEFERLANGEEGDPVELLKKSVTPKLEITEQLDVALEAAVGWLFNSYRIERSAGEYVRGDLHMGLIGDPGTAKSTILSSLARIAPKAVYRSGGAISKVGLTAAAVQEEFAGDTEWTLEPGVLPRANGGHCLIDEVDEILDERSKAIHDALEGEQMVKVSKAGIHAELPTRAALLISGNPKEGRFDRFEPIADQLDMDPAFISRIDILLPVTDVLERDRDRRIAETNIRSYREMSEEEKALRDGRDPPERDQTKRPVEIPVIRDWVHYARENVFPVLSDEASELLAETYLEARNLNGAYESSDATNVIPVTVRVLEAAIRLSTAYARVELDETVRREHVERAQRILRQSMGLNFDKETGQFDADLTSEAMPKSQRDRVHGIRDIIVELADELDGDPPRRRDVIAEAAEEYDVSEDKIEHDLRKLRERGEVYEPESGVLMVV